MSKKEFFNPASLAYKALIETLCVSLNSISNIKYFVLYIIFNDGEQFVLSNTPEQFLTFYWEEQFKKYDYSTDISLFQNENYYLCNEKHGVDLIFKEVLEAQFNLYRTYYIARHSPECRLIFGALHNYQINNSLQIYMESIDKFENFCIEFLDKTIDIIKLHNPNYDRSIILNDKNYRQSIIKGWQKNHQDLSFRELECLYWAANGKSSEETAIILNIKKPTVEDYRKQIKRKLNCSNITHAVYEAVKKGYIGSFHRLNSSFYEEGKKKTS